MAERERTKAAKKLLGAESSQTRMALVTAAEQLMRDEGYAAVTSRRIASHAGLKHQVIYYYFETLDDLFLEVFRRGSAAGLARMIAALDSAEPLRALWEVSSEPGGARFVMEFMALANHNPVIRAEIARYAAETRKLQAQAISRHLAARGVAPRVSPVLVSVLISALARLLVNEESVGVEIGHAEARELIETCLRHFEQTGGAGLPVPAPAPAG